MLARTFTIPVASAEVTHLSALMVEPELDRGTAPVLLFLHGKGEAGSSLSALPLVCIHQTPPFQAILGRLPGTLVIAPQAPPIPSWDDWNWRDYTVSLAGFLSNQYPNRRLLATGFSRGGLGVLQLISAYPDLVQAWGVVDPSPPPGREESETILSSMTRAARGWLRYGEFRNKSEEWRRFSSLLSKRLPEESRDTVELTHGEMAAQAYSGYRLPEGSGKKNLYDFLGLSFDRPD